MGGAVAEDVRRRILSMLSSGALRPGSRLGTEREMAERFDVSRATLRSALLPLSQAGVLERRTGRTGGTFVRADIVQRQAAEQAGLPALLHSGGHSSYTKVLATDSRPATAAESVALEIPDGEPVVVIRRLRYADGVPLSVDQSCFVAAHAADLLATASSGSEATIQRLATCSIGSASAAFSISIGSSMECFCSAVSDNGAQNRVFSSASSGSVS